MNIQNYTQEELDALEERTNNIAANLRYIEEHGELWLKATYYHEALEELEERLDRICSSLRYIEDHEELWLKAAKHLE
jgi:hypothetical protein